MILLVLAYLGGVLTIRSPCILPVLPLVFARAGQPFVRSRLPMLGGMAVTFAMVATLAAVGGGWAVQANQVGRFAALLILAFFGVTLVFPALTYRFHARDLLLVLGTKGRPARFRVRIDGATPGQNHGSDTDSGGNGVVTEQRLYQLIRSSGEIKDHTFDIPFLDPGAQAFAFTFG